MRKSLHIDALEVGMFITAVLNQNGPVKVRKVGIVRSQEMVKGLKEMGVLEVEVDLEESLDTDPAPAQSPSQRLMANSAHTDSSDRALSQQFYRTLYLSDSAKMPTVWRLYYQPWVLMTCIFIGALALALFSTQLVKSQFTAAPLSSVEIITPVLEAEPQEQATESSIDVPPSSEPESALVASEINATRTEPEVKAEPELELESEDPIYIADQEGKIINAPPAETSTASLPADLVAKFNQALDELEQESRADEQTPSNNAGYDDVPRVDQLSVSVLTQLPSMSFSAHMYATSPENRWVRVNGKRLQEGDFIASDLQLVNIEPQRVILAYKQEVFSMNALADW